MGLVAHAIPTVNRNNSRRDVSDAHIEFAALIANPARQHL